MLAWIYDWQTLVGSLIAGVLAVLAAFATIRATSKSADREVAAAQKQLDATLRIERRRRASEALAFLRMVDAAMVIVIRDVGDARNLGNFNTGDKSPMAFRARQMIKRTGFHELRVAFVRYGDLLTETFLSLDNEIDELSADWVWEPTAGRDREVGLHENLNEQLNRIEFLAKSLRKEAEKEMDRCNKDLADFTRIDHDDP